MEVLISSILVIIKGYGVQATLIEGKNAFAQKCEIELKELEAGPNMHDHISILYIPFILRGSLNEDGYVRAVHA